MSGRRKKAPAQSPVIELPPPAPFHWRAIWPFLALISATLLAYLPSLAGGVLWDDDAHLTRPAIPSIHGLSPRLAHLAFPPPDFRHPPGLPALSCWRRALGRRRPSHPPRHSVHPRP